MSLNKEEFTELLEALGKQIAPLVDAAAKSAVAAFSPVAAIVADPIIDAIDAHVIGLLNGGKAPAPTAPMDPESRVQALEKHVAALTVATGHGTSAALPIIKASPVTVADAS
jgi:hypothetical protein